MPCPTTIVSCSYHPFDVPLVTSFGIAGGAIEVACSVLVTLVLHDGTRGYGEAAPLPAFNGETREAVLLALKQVAPALVGMDVRNYRRVCLELVERFGISGSARGALETAVFDAFARHARIPLWAFFGGREDRVETDMTIPLGTREQASEAAQGLERKGFRRIKVKVGSGDDDLDESRVRSIHESAPSASIMLDGNGGYTANAAIGFAERLARCGVEPILFEQPVRPDDWEGLRAVSAKTRIPVAADETVCTAADALRVSRERVASVVNIKLMKSGVIEALDIASVCRVGGLRLMIGGMVETSLAMSMSACFAGGLGGFDFVDLDTPFFMGEHPFEGGFQARGPVLDLQGIQAGHGVSPRMR